MNEPALKIAMDTLEFLSLGASGLSEAEVESLK